MQTFLQAYKAFRLHKDLFNLDRITNKNENILAGAAVGAVRSVGNTRASCMQFWIWVAENLMHLAFYEVTFAKQNFYAFSV